VRPERIISKSNLLPSSHMDLTGPLVSQCEKCGRTGQIYDKFVYPNGLIRVDGWECDDGNWRVINPRCVGRHFPTKVESRGVEFGK